MRRVRDPLLTSFAAAAADTAQIEPLDPGQARQRGHSKQARNNYSALHGCSPAIGWSAPTGGSWLIDRPDALMKRI
jgi:hypothetical protein